MKRIILEKCFFLLKILGVSLIFLSLLLSGPITAWSKQAQIADSIVTNNQDHLLVYFFTKGCFTPEMNKAIQNGIPTTFTFLIELYKPRSIWPNKHIASLKIHHTVKYDSLRDEYSIQLSERGNQTFVVKEFSKAQEMMADVSNIQLIPFKHWKGTTSINYG